MQIRPFRSCDAAALAALFHASVREGGLLHYSPDQVAAWSPAPPDPAAYHARAARHCLLVAVDEADRPIGYGDLRPDGYIDHLYCHPDRIGRGVGGALIAALEAEARRAGLPALWVHASEGARLLLARRGFRLDHRRDFAINGVAIHNFHMVKAIGG